MSTKELIFDILANNKASKVFKDVANDGDHLATKVSAWGKVGAVAAAAVGVAAVKFGIDSVKAYSEAEESQNRLQDAFTKFPALADTNIDKMRNLNTELGKKTKFDDDATASGQAVLAQFGLTGTQLEQITPLLQDYAAKTGKDLPSAAEDLGKAMLGQGKALKGIGLNFKDAGSTGANFDQVMSGLSEKVGGFAEKEGTTAAGKTEILKNQFGELEETVGSGLLPVMSKMVDVGLKVVGWISQNMPLTAALAGVFLVLASAIAVAANWTAISTTYATIATAAQWLWNAALDANPISLIIIAIAALVAGIIYFFTKTELGQQIWATFTAYVSASWELIKTAFKVGYEKVSGFLGTLWQVIKTLWEYSPLGVIVTNWDSILTFFKGIGDKIGTALNTVVTALTSPFKTAFNKISDLWNSTIGGFTMDLPAILGGAHLSIPKMPRVAGYAAGTMSAASGLAWVGERGPELVNFRGGEQVYRNGTGPASNSRMHPDDIEALGQVMGGVVLAGISAGTASAQQARVSATTRRAR